MVSNNEPIRKWRREKEKGKEKEEEKI